ncbi:MAG: response regulator transcription factor [Pseudomonadota bacterium]
MNIFIVEDSEALRERLIAMLQDIREIRISGYAEDAYQAIESFLKLVEITDRPDVVILDMQLVEGNGLDVLKFVKKNFTQTKVIMLTNYSQEQYRKKCAEEGADYFFDKSTEFMKVHEVLESLVKSA